MAGGRARRRWRGQRGEEDPRRDAVGMTRQIHDSSQLDEERPARRSRSATAFAFALLLPWLLEKVCFGYHIWVSFVWRQSNDT